MENNVKCIYGHVVIKTEKIGKPIKTREILPIWICVRFVFTFLTRAKMPMIRLKQSDYLENKFSAPHKFVFGCFLLDPDEHEKMCNSILY